MREACRYRDASPVEKIDIEIARLKDAEGLWGPGSFAAEIDLLVKRKAALLEGSDA